MRLQVEVKVDWMGYYAVDAGASVAVSVLLVGVGIEARVVALCDDDGCNQGFVCRQMVLLIQVLLLCFSDCFESSLNLRDFVM